jgi:DNA polymerase-3 subunit alpha
MDGFAHLHVHTHYSLLDGACRIGELVDTAGKLGMDSLAITDHGNLYGAMEFYSAATAAGIRPILGMEAYISPTTRDDRDLTAQTAAYHLLLLAMNETGWRNLVKLSSRAYLEGFYYRPRVDRELLSELNEGLICTTACLGGEVPAALLADRPEQAERIAGEYRDIFGPERFFIEVQRQGLADQDRVNPHLVALAARLGVGIVGTNDVHFLRREDKPAHEVLTCISTGKTLGDEGRMVYSPELYLKSPEQMREALAPWPEAADNTLRIAEMCELKLDGAGKHLPTYQTPDGESEVDHLRKLAEEGLRWRFGDNITAEHRQRMEHELATIEAKGYSSYILIVRDFVQFARRNNIPSAPRGSACATLLGYCLGIGDVNPLRYGLLFERWTDVQREEDPDFDIDICQEGRAKVIQYVREKYGHVAQIITYGTLKARAAIRDVGRVMGVPLAEVDAIAKKIPEGLKVTISSALETEPDLRKMYDSDEQVKRLFDNAMSLEGLARHAGVHAAGVIVASEPLENLVPLCRQADSDDAITQWDGPTCDEKVGLMKMDFLGLRTLTIIQRARELVHQRTGEDLDPEMLPLDDDEVYELFRQGHTDGVFQFESKGMRSVLSQMQPRRIEDLIAANAMYRPGPMELIPSYCARANGREEVPSIHPLVDDILAETYGIMVYQEQVMQVLNRLGGLPLSRALTLIKAISKKKEKTIAAERPNFLAGARANGIAEAEAQRLFELIMKFAGYGFNKAHSTRYAIVAYQTAYFKTHYPREFLAATLTFESGDTDKVEQYMAEAARMGVTIAPPDVNACGRDFTVDGRKVRFGLAAVKGVGGKAVDAIVEARKEGGAFRDLYHFCEQADLRAVNRSAIEALIKCGAFDALGAHRAAMLAALDDAVQLGQAASAARRSGQMSFFGAGGLVGDEQAAPVFPNVEPLSEAQLLAAEKDALGFFISSHPLVKYGRELDSLSQPPGTHLATVGNLRDGTQVVIGCMIASVQLTHTRKDNSRMARLVLEDLTGRCEAVAFPRTFEQLAERLRPEALVFVRGTADFRMDRANVIIDDVLPIDKAVAELTGKVLIRLSPAGLSRPVLDKTAAVIGEHKGNCPLLFEMTPSEQLDVRAVVRAEKNWFVKPSRALMDELEKLFRQEDLVLAPAPTANSAPRRDYRNGSYRGGDRQQAAAS